jgi:hypothetical protein
MKVSHSLPGAWTSRRIGGKRQAWRKGKEGETKKDCFFDTSEATILLKTKDGDSQRAQKQTDLQAQISPKMRSKSAIFANFRPHLCLARAKLQGAT